MLLTVFWRKKRAKSASAEKWKAEEYRYLSRVTMKLQFHNTWITLAKKSKMLQIFFLALESWFAPLQNFSCACKFNLRLQSYVHLHNSYPTHGNILGIKLPSYESTSTCWQQYSPELLKVQTPDREGIKSGPASTSYFKRTCITQTSVRGPHARTHTRTHARGRMNQCCSVYRLFCKTKRIATRYFG